MARRGRFGRSETGASDLSAAIRSLVNQQKSAEEQAFMKAFYDGTEYNGKIPTISDVISFYEEIASLSGIDKESEDFISLQQKIGDANNFDIKRDYNSLIAEFNSSDGSNYSEIVDFLEGRAQDSTNENDVNDFKTGLDDITGAFLNYKGEALKRGELTAKEYQAITLDALQVLEPGSAAYSKAVYDSFTWEWNAESTKWTNRIKAGKATAAQFENWAKGFANRATTSGIEKKSELYTGIFATVASYNGSYGGGGGGVGSRSANIESKLGKIYAAALRAPGIQGYELTQGDLASGKSYSASDYASNPGAFSGLIRLIESGAIEMPQELVKLGYEDVNDLQRGLTNLVRGFEAEAQSLAATSSSDSAAAQLAQAKTLSRSVGAKTQVDELADAVNQFSADVQKYGAAEDDIGLKIAMDEMGKFYSGQPSIYGKIDLSKDLAPKGFAQYGQSLKAAFDASAAALSGNGIPSGAVALEDFFGVFAGFDGQSGITFSNVYSSGDIEQTNGNFERLTNGQAVQVVTYDPETGRARYTTSDMPAVTSTGFLGNSAVPAKGGMLSIMTFKKMPDGSFVPVIQSIQNIGTIQTASGTGTTVWGYQYQLPSGSAIYVKTTGESFDGDPFQTQARALGDGNYFVDSPAIRGDATKRTSVPTIDLQSLLLSAGGQEADYESIRNVVNDVRKKISDPNSPWQAALGVSNLDAIENDLGQLTDKANKMELDSVNKQLGDIKRGFLAGSRDTIIDLEARKLDLEAGGDTGNLFINNKAKYVESQPGVFTLRETEFKGSAFEFASLLNVNPGALPTRDASGRELPKTIDFRTPDVKAADAARKQAELAAKPVADGYPFLRNLNEIKQPMQVQTPTGAAPISPYLATQVTQPQVKTATPPAPTVQKFTAPQVQQSLVDFRAGERAPLGPVKPPVAVQPAPGSSLRPGDRNR
jgi:hypothetical protein